jgi:hypothetical protein
MSIDDYVEKFNDMMENEEERAVDPREVRFDLFIDYDHAESFDTLQEALDYRNDPETQALHYKLSMEIISYNKDDEELEMY